MRPLRLPDLKASFGRWQAGLAERGWNSLYWNNHDQPRVVSRFGDDGAAPGARRRRCSATVLHLHRGTPYVYQGEELGMTNAPFGVDRRLPRHRVAQPLRRGGRARRRDPSRVLAALRAMSRDNARTPMQWDASPHAGFTTGDAVAAGQPEPRRDQRRGRSVDDPDSVFHHYRRLIALRHTEPVVAHGDFTMLLPDDERVYAFTRGRSGTSSCWCWATSPATTSRGPAARRDWSGAEVVLANLPEPADRPGWCCGRGSRWCGAAHRLIAAAERVHACRASRHCAG